MKDLNLPIKFIGVGERLEDLIPFDRKSYISGLIMNKKREFECLYG